jgi:S-adenosylmethionine-diacylgycerolhomoserine-N-methlytransferase
MSEADARRLKAYYHLHSLIYDATRWSFLFGRDQILRNLSTCCPAPRQILEVGCGTGKNLKKLCALHPEATVTGLDLSEDMLRVARRKLAPYATRMLWHQRAYDAPISNGKPFDMALFSYSLSMFNPGWKEAIATALADLAEGACLGVVDFHSSPLVWFRKWMEWNHVRMEGHLLPFLKQSCQTRLERVVPAYGGCWRYFLFVGEKRS